jgi:hypothetical protein
MESFDLRDETTLEKLRCMLIDVRPGEKVGAKPRGNVFEQ